MRDEWIRRLRSGEYEQGHGLLHAVNDRGIQYCCLGVLCEIHAESGAGEFWDPNSSGACSYQVHGVAALNISLPSELVLEWAGLNSADLTPLWKRNDGIEDFYSHSFAEIADYIEENL